MDGCPTFAPAYSGFPVDLAGAGELHVAFLNESRTRGYWWRLVQEIRIRGPKKMGAAQRSIFLINQRLTFDTRRTRYETQRFETQKLNSAWKLKSRTAEPCEKNPVASWFDLQKTANP